MGATNTTANYNLSQFIGTDKPAWLQDYNGDMLKIDTGINAAKVTADGAQNAASAAQNDATTANNAITNTITPAISSLNTTVGNQGGAINTINSLIGNGTPTTTDQTIIGAINEINSELQYPIATEIVVGEFNGKTLYRKVYRATGQNITSSTDIDVTLNSTNIEDVLFMKVNSKTSSGLWITDYDEDSSGTRQECIITVTTGSVRLGVAGLTITDYVAVIEYTKV